MRRGKRTRLARGTRGKANGRLCGIMPTPSKLPSGRRRKTCRAQKHPGAKELRLNRHPGTACVVWVHVAFGVRVSAKVGLAMRRGDRQRKPQSTPLPTFHRLIASSSMMPVGMHVPAVKLKSKIDHGVLLFWRRCSCGRDFRDRMLPQLEDEQQKRYGPTAVSQLAV